jgi:hypothetical protein
MGVDEIKLGHTVREDGPGGERAQNHRNGENQDGNSGNQKFPWRNFTFLVVVNRHFPDNFQVYDDSN